MRVVVNDYSGHPFQVQLSRELARLGHDVLHIYFQDFPTPKGELTRRSTDPPGFHVVPITLGAKFTKTDLIRRRSQEIRYARKASQKMEEFGPDVVIGCNNPLDAQKIIQGRHRQQGAKFVFWLQDLYSVAITEILSRKYSAPGRLLGLWYQQIERTLLRRSDAVVAISSDFVPQLQAWSVAADRIHVIPNWAPLDTITLRPKDNSWSRRYGLADKKVVLYTGTLGFKHNPRLLLDLADGLRDRVDVKVVVISEGQGADFLNEEITRRKTPNMIVLPFQPMSEYSAVLGTADVLVSIMESEAGRFSVPSKVLSYLCSGKAQVLCVPLDNLAAKTVIECGAGTVVPPGNAPEFVRAVEAFLSDQAKAAEAGRAGRAYAERTFDIAAIASKFERILHGDGVGVARHRDGFGGSSAERTPRTAGEVFRNAIYGRRRS